MSEIPESVALEAKNIVDAMPARTPWKHEVEDAIALAILAEREACAKTAEGNAKVFDFQTALADGDDMEVGAKSVQLAISDAIRRR